MLPLNVVACYVVFVWASWCIYAPTVKDGVFGRLFYSIIAIAGFAAATCLAEPRTLAAAQTAMNVAFAGLGIRHFVMKHYRKTRGMFGGRGI